MTFYARASALFVGSARFRSYHEAIQVEEPRQAELKRAQLEIRQALRDAARLLTSDARFWRGRLATASPSGRPIVVPKFRTQGSVDYDLLVDPCSAPPQQIDLDDGVYFNVEFLEDGEPALVAKALFAFVEEALALLCRRRGWDLQLKDCCVRVQVSEDSHVDLPLYSAPREAVGFALEHVALAKRASERLVRLPSDKIMLAHRDGTWLQSDPLRMSDWVRDCVRRYGRDFRRVCRYLKGWRDNRWARPRLSSIAIMVSVDRALDALDGRHRSLPDDHLFYEVAQRLPGILRSDLVNPVVKDRRLLLNDWPDDVCRDILEGADRLAADMHDALKGTLDPTLVVDALRRALGTRLPYRPDAVEMLPAVAATVAAERPATVPSPAVGSSTSG